MPASDEDGSLIVFACEAGIGSSPMGANQLKKLVKRRTWMCRSSTFPCIRFRLTPT